MSDENASTETTEDSLAVSEEDNARSFHDPYAPGGRVLGPTDEMQRGGRSEPQPGADEDGFGGDAPEPANDGTVKELLEEAKDDPDKAAEILAAEQELPEDEQRTTLVEGLEPVAAEAVPDGNAGEVMAWVNEEGADTKDRAQRALDAEEAGQQRKGLTNELKAVLEG